MNGFNFKYDKNSNTYIESRVVSGFINKVFGWLMLGILVTAGVLFTILNNTNALVFVLKNNLHVISLFVMLGISFFLSFSVRSSLNTVRIAYISYCILTGISLTFLIAFDPRTVLFVLLATSSIFGVSAIYGYLTGEDLSKFTSVLAVSLVFLVVVNITNLFLRLEFFDMIIGYFGAVIFTALVAVKVQSLKQLAVALSDSYGEDRVDRFAVFGAFSLFLSFINLF